MASISYCRRRILGAIAALAAVLGWCTAATAAAPPAEAFAELPAMSMVRLSPDGRTIAYAGFRAGARAVFTVDVATHRYLRTIEPEPVFKLRNVEWADDHTLLLTLSRLQANNWLPNGQRHFEFFRVVAVGATGDDKPRVLLMDDAARQVVTGAKLVSLHASAPDSVVMATWDFYVAARQEAIGSRLAGGRKDEGWLYSLFDVSTQTGTGKLLAAGTPYTQRWIVDPHGQPVARADWNPATREYRVLVNDSGNWRAIYTADDDASLYPVCLDADGKALVALGARGGDHVRAWRMPLDGGPVTLLYEGTEDVEGLDRDRFTGAPAAVYLGGLVPTVHWFDTRMAGIDTALHRAFPDSTVDTFDRSQDYTRVLARVEHAGGPPVYYLIDLSKGTADIVGEAYPQLTKAALGLRRAVEYAARDGVRIPAYLTLPPGPGAKNLPLVVLPHGGPWARDDRGFDWLAQFIATRGYAVLQPQFRGSVGFGTRLENAGKGGWGRAMQDDITDGVRYLEKEGIADPRRVCIVGGSYGGYAALAGAAFTPDLYACAASIAGVSDLAEMQEYIRKHEGDESDAYIEWKDLVGLPLAELDAVSPLHAVDQVKAPVLLLHGTADTVVPYSQSASFAKQLEADGKQVRFVSLAGEDHWLSQSATRLQAMRELEQFLARYLQPGAAQPSIR